MAEKTMDDVRNVLKREKPIYDHVEPGTPEGRVIAELEKLAVSCQSFGEFMEQAARLYIGGPGIEEVAIAKEQLEIVLTALRGESAESEEGE
jgi:hypothetical protein